MNARHLVLAAVLAGVAICGAAVYLANVPIRIDQVGFIGAPEPDEFGLTTATDSQSGTQKKNKSAHELPTSLLVRNGRIDTVEASESMSFALTRTAERCSGVHQMRNRKETRLCS